MENEELERLFRACAGDVFRLAYSFLASRADTEDVCQAVFLKLAEGRARPEPGKEKAYLLTCTANTCKNVLRSFWRRNARELDDQMPFQTPEDTGMWAAVRSLPPPYRAAIHLYFYEGYDQREIGRILGISRSAVQARISRACKMLRKELDDDAGTTLPEHDGKSGPY